MQGFDTISLKHPAPFVCVGSPFIHKRSKYKRRFTAGTYILKNFISMAYQLFRQMPPLATVHKVFNSFDIFDIHDAVPFTRADVGKRDVGKKLSLIPELRDIYLPCKAAIYLSEPISISRCLTILRHMLRTVNASLETTEQYMCGHKVVVYRITVDGNRGSIIHVSKEPRKMFEDDSIIQEQSTS